MSGTVTLASISMAAAIQVRAISTKDLTIIVGRSFLCVFQTFRGIAAVHIGD